MVKISFQQQAVGLKDEKEEADGANSEILLPQDPETLCPAPSATPSLRSPPILAHLRRNGRMDEQPPPVQTRRSSLSAMCYLIMGLIVLLLGLVFASMYVYRYFLIAQFPQIPRENVFHCGVMYEDSIYSPFKGKLELQEEVKIYVEENYEQINVPVPKFGGSDPADIIHDFQKMLTAYHDIALDKCYVIELNTTIVMPPRNFWELLINVKKGTYLPQTYIIQEEMIVTEQVNDVEQLGSFISRLCSAKETYRLKRRTARRRINRRQTDNCIHIRHFENTFVVETIICEMS